VTDFLSVLLPCRNAEAFVSDALASIERQTFTDFEVIAVDDGSTDATAAILSDRAAGDPRVRVLRTPARGIASALTTACAAARAETVARMDADDVAEPDRFARQLEWLDARPDHAGCGTGVRYFPRALVRDGASRYEDWINGTRTADDVVRDAFIECPLAHPTLMLRRSALDRVGGYRDRGWPEDYDLVLRLLAAGQRLGNVPAVLHHWRERPDRATRTDARYSLDAFDRCKAHHLARTHLAARDAVVCGAGPVGKRLARALLAEGARLRAFVELDPRKIGQCIHGAPVLGYDAVPLHSDAYFLAAVAGGAARSAIRTALRDAGLTEVEDFRAVA